MLIHEVYYDRDGGVISWSKHASGCGGETLPELKMDVAMHMKALERPVLKESELPDVRLWELGEDYETKRKP